MKRDVRKADEEEKWREKTNYTDKWIFFYKISRTAE